MFLYNLYTQTLCTRVHYQYTIEIASPSLVIGVLTQCTRGCGGAGGTRVHNVGVMIPGSICSITSVYKATKMYDVFVQNKLFTVVIFHLFV